MYKGVFSGMLAWSDGSSPKDALRLGVQAGMASALQEGGTINKFMTAQKEGNRDLLLAIEGGAAWTKHLSEAEAEQQKIYSNWTDFDFQNRQERKKLDGTTPNGQPRRTRCTKGAIEGITRTARNREEKIYF